MDQLKNRLDIDQVREKLATKQGPEYWRSLEQVAETEEFQAWMDDEFPNRSSLNQIDRRSLLKFMGASMMLAGLSGCRSAFLPNARLVPYVTRPEELVNGDTLRFASISELSGYADGIVVTSHYGRPTKIEGNPLHPSSLGATTAITQASILNLYDPDRSRNVMQDGIVTTWSEFLSVARAKMTKAQANGGAGVALLVPSVGSPSYRKTLEDFQKKMPNAIVASWEPVNRDHVYQGAMMAFGKAVETTYHLSNADRILLLDADAFGSMVGSVRMAKEFSARRDPENAAGMNRLYALECAPSGSGAIADHKEPVSTSDLEIAIRLLAIEAGISADASGATPELTKWVAAVAKDLMSNAGRGVVIPGDFVSAEGHALCHAINAKLGGVGTLVKYGSAVIFKAGQQLESLQKLSAALSAGKVDSLFILGGNPAYDAPADLKLGELIAKMKPAPGAVDSKLVVRLGTHWDETSKISTWHLPESHSLESWGDGITAEGTISIQQPLIDPLFDTKSAWATLRAIMNDMVDPYDVLLQTYAGGAENAAWRTSLNNGILKEAPSSSAVVAVNTAAVSGIQPVVKKDGIEIILRPDPTIYDGRFANNGWLQELPKPLTTLTWDNTIQISPALASELKIASGDEIEVKVGEKMVKGGAWILPGQPAKTVTIHLGYGREIKDALISVGAGFSAYSLLTTSGYVVPGSLTKTGGRVALASTQEHHAMEGRDIIREQTLADFIAMKDDHGTHGSDHGGEEKHGGEAKYGGEEAEAHGHKEMSMYPSYKTEFPYDGPQWGMTIDLNTCTGCHACVTACQSENNIAVVGKDQVIKGREMHWIRIDRYYGPREASYAIPGKEKAQDLDNPSTHFMPLACFHCEIAPCEPVCPVAATVHSHEGLNQMVYNRCVGTRYCSNNCPYKVRRFNFLNYNDRKFSDFNPLDGARNTRDLRVKLMVNNPNVTVRGRGVMEKCTYCVQRINEARIHAKLEHSKGRREQPDPKDGEIITACQAACPTGAIMFGNIADPNSQVSKLKENKRNYTLLAELNTRNRTTYLHKVSNPNKEMKNA
jgi:molybdopterin-containing oxidoreductase family iron-sulfur binding subunit